MDKLVGFPLNDAGKITLAYQGPLSEVSCCDEGKIILIQNNGREAILSQSAVRNDMEGLSFLLTKTLCNNLPLHSSLVRDIGYLYNQYSYYLSTDCLGTQKMNEFVDEEVDGSQMWVGVKYHLWAGGGLVTWLYNDAQGSIVLEITPFYPFLSIDPKSKKDYVPYDSWISQYKPYFTTIISREIAQQWLEQANTIVQQIQDNIARWEAEENNVSI